MFRIEIGKKLSVLPLKTLQPTKIHNKSKISLIDFLEKLRGIKPIFTHFSGHFGLQDGRRGSKKIFFAIFQLSSSRPFIWYQICTENPVIRKKVSKPPYLPLKLIQFKIYPQTHNMMSISEPSPVFSIS